MTSSVKLVDIFVDQREPILKQGKFTEKVSQSLQLNSVSVLILKV